MPGEFFEPVAVLFGMVTFFAVFNERFVEYVLAPIFDSFPALAEYKWGQRYIALLSGLGLVGFLFPVDLIGPVLASFNVVSPLPSAGAWVTALMVGAGSSFLHDIYQ